MLNGCTETNNKFLKSYNANKRISYIKYLDANNLYEHSMMQLLPTEILHWVSPNESIMVNSLVVKGFKIGSKNFASLLVGVFKANKLKFNNI